MGRVSGSERKAEVVATALDAFLLLLGRWSTFSNRSKSCLTRSDLERYKQRCLRYFTSVVFKLSVCMNVTFEGFNHPCDLCGFQVLLVSSSRHPDRWIVPGGGMEPEEEPSVAAAREVCEEVCAEKQERGVPCSRGALLDVVLHLLPLTINILMIMEGI